MARSAQQGAGSGVLQRVRAIDLARGAAVSLMVIYNWTVTLDYFDLFRPPSSEWWSFWVPAVIAAVFIFLAGVAARLSWDRHPAGFDHRYFRRGAKLVAYSAAISLFTSVFVPEGAIFFGILQFFAVTSFLIPFLVDLDRVNLGGGMAALAIGAFLLQFRFDFGWLFWLGFVPANYYSFDYFPLLPWMGVLMLGIYFSGVVVKRMRNARVGGGAFAGAVEFLGRHSLEVYLVHQPLLILALAAAGMKTF